MKVWFDRLPMEARWVIGVALASVSALILAFLVEVMTMLAESLQERGRHEPRIARMLGYEATARELQTSAREFSRALETLAYPEADDANTAGARLQQTLRGFAEESGLIVAGSQLAIISPADDEDDEDDGADGLFDQLAVDLSLDGPPLALDAFLVAVSQHSPALATVSIDIQRKRRSRREGNETLEFLTIRLRVVALRVAA